MSVSIVDLAEPSHYLVCNWWTWRPTLRIIERLIAVPPEQLELMKFDGGCGRLTREQARALAVGLRAHVLPMMPLDGRFTLDGEIRTEPDDGTFHRDPASAGENYSAPRQWLEDLATFCERCGGFEVG